MPYATNADLPSAVRGKLPGHAQDVFREVFNQEKDKGHPDSRAFATAWTAVKNGWRKTPKGWTRKSYDVEPPALAKGALLQARIDELRGQLPAMTAEAVLERYSPDQPRDDHGRWTSTGLSTEGMPKPGEPGRVAALVAEAHNQRVAVNAAAAPIAAAAQAGGLKYIAPDRVPVSVVHDLNLDVKDPAPDPARATEGARQVGLAVDQLRAAGMGRLADQIATQVPVIAVGEQAWDGHKLTPDTGAIMTTISGPEGQFINVNTNSISSIDVPINTYSPALCVELKAKMDAGMSREDGLKFEMRGAAIHEFGHVLDNLNNGAMTASLGRTLQKTLGPTWQLDAGPWLASHVSGYATVMPEEATAEAFYRMVTGKLPSELKGWGDTWRKRASYG